LLSRSAVLRSALRSSSVSKIRPLLAVHRFAVAPERRTPMWSFPSEEDVDLEEVSVEPQNFISAPSARPPSGECRRPASCMLALSPLAPAPHSPGLLVVSR
jgi:hypothetical protein